MKYPAKIYLKLLTKFDIATSLFRSFEISAISNYLSDHNLNEPILDIGCAEGNIGKLFFSNKNSIGIDFDLAFLRQAYSKHIYKHLILADARSMPFKDGFFLSLFSNSVIEHIKDLKLVLNEANRVIDKNGQFLFTVPNNNFTNYLFFSNFLNLFGLKSLANKYVLERNSRLNHFHLYSKEEWTKILEENNFEIITMKEYGPKAMLLFWDLIASFQFILRFLFGFLLRVLIIRYLIRAISFMLKIIFGIILLPFFVVFNKSSSGCATLIMARKIK